MLPYLIFSIFERGVERWKVYAISTNILPKDNLLIYLPASAGPHP